LPPRAGRNEGKTCPRITTGEIVVKTDSATTFTFGYRNEFVQLLRLAQLASGMKPLDRTRSGVPQ